jgi:hypothetical protein
VMTSVPQRWARVPPALAWKRPGLPTEWTRVLERNEEAMNPEPLSGYVWLESWNSKSASGRVRPFPVFSGRCGDRREAATSSGASSPRGAIYSWSRG